LLDVDGVDLVGHVVAELAAVEGVLGRVQNLVVDVVVAGVAPDRTRKCFYK
jgi:hypothetical protein